MFAEAYAVSLERAIAVARDTAFVFSIAVLGWKGRSWFQPILDFFNRVNGHMDKVESGIDTMQTGMKTLLDNHMHHVQEHLKTLADARIEDNAIRKQSTAGLSTRPSRHTRKRKTS